MKNRRCPQLGYRCGSVRHSGTSTRRLAICIALFAVFQAAWFAPVVKQGFIADDLPWLASAERISRGEESLLSREISGFFRPVIYLTFLTNYRLCGLSAAGYNVVNIALEMACTVVLCVFVFRLTGSATLAIGGMLLFATHSSHGEVVGWISARTSSTCCLLSMLTLLAWMRWRGSRKRPWWAAAFALHALALLSKEEAVALLPVIAVLDLLLLAPKSGEAAATTLPQPKTAASLFQRVRWTAWPLTPFAVVLAAYLVAQVAFQSENWIVRGGAYRPQWSAALRLYSRVAELFISKRVVQSPYLQAVFLSYLVGGWLLIRAARPQQRRWAIFGLVAACLALFPTLFFSTHDAARYRYVATSYSAIAWCGIGAILIRPGAVRRGAAVAVGLLIAATIVLQAVDQRQRLRDWNHRGALTRDVLASTMMWQEELQAAAATGRTIHVIDAPRDTEIHSLLWLIGGVDRERVVAAKPVDGPAAASPAPGDVVIRWVQQERRWELEVARGPTTRGGSTSSITS